MAQGDKKIGSLTYKEGNDSYNVVSVWESARYPGSYSLSRDRESSTWGAISLIDALKGFCAGRGYINFRMAQQESQPRQQQRQQPPRGGHQSRGGSAPQRAQPSHYDSPPDDFAVVDDIPF